jgi:hypothetical protein
MAYRLALRKRGRHSDIWITYVMRPRQAIWMTTKGQIESYMSTIVISGGTTPLGQKKVIPKEGLMRTVSAFTTNITSNHNRSMTFQSPY